ncbi:peptidyl-prolyl cis-trans isomerase FKBP4 isoform X2 [Orussus abietinus]|nr:peptidyl-prolyl cis-trans isomerase FKBP4 isoform X2 [Orussus abietinus]
MPEVDITKKQDGGVLKEIIKEGVGEEKPLRGCSVTVHYTGTLLDGTKFDSSRDRDEPFKFVLGRGNVIKAWDIGIATMKKGEVAVLTCTAKYAYGKSGTATIPPNATLKFEVEMIDWTGEDVSTASNGSILKFQINPGEGYASPQEGALVNVHLVGKYNDQVFEQRDVQFTLGEGEDAGIIEGVEEALQHFQNGEKARLKINSTKAFKNEGNSKFNIPPGADVEYIVELKSFEKSVEEWSLEPAKKIEQAKLYKEKGTSYFKANKYNLAIKLYKKITTALKSELEFKDELVKEQEDLLLSAHLNLALCYLKTNSYVEAKDSCNEALNLSPTNEKALFRRGQAYIALASPEIAVKDFQEVLKVEPKNAAAAKQVTVCNNLIKKQIAREKKLYANMFDTFAKQDKQ